MSSKGQLEKKKKILLQRMMSVSKFKDIEWVYEKELEGFMRNVSNCNLFSIKPLNTEVSKVLREDDVKYKQIIDLSEYLADLGLSVGGLERSKVDVKDLKDEYEETFHVLYNIVIEARNENLIGPLNYEKWDERKKSYSIDKEGVTSTTAHWIESL